MSIRSPLKRWVRRFPDRHGESKPASVAYGQALACNAIHAADSSGQVIACWKIPAASALTHAAKSGSGVAWLKVWESLPYVPTLQPDGTPFEMRIGLAGRATNASGCAFRIVVAAVGSAPFIVQDVSPTGCSEHAAPDVTDSWRTGSFAALAPRRSSVDASIQGLVVASELAGAASEGIRVPLWSVSVWFEASSVADGELTGVYAAEWAGN